MIQENQGSFYINLVARWGVPYGKAVYCLGDCPQLGQWQPKRAHRLTYISQNIWQSSVALTHTNPTTTQIQYKFLTTNYSQIDPTDLQWQSHPNRITSPIPTLSSPSSLTICSFNIRYQTEHDKNEKNWQYRKLLIVNFLKEKMYDVVGVQEATYRQRKYLQENLGEYEYYGRARDLGQGEECGVFVLKGRYGVVLDQYQWISESKQPGVPGYFTTVLITPIITTKPYQKPPCLAILNTHLDHHSKISRQKGLQQLLQKPQNLPQVLSPISTIIMGDFNLPSNHAYLNQFPKNSYISMRSIEGADQSISFNGFQKGFLLGLGQMLGRVELMIDHMFFKGDFGKVWPVGFGVEGKEGELMSDHFPIVGTFLCNI